MFVLFINYRYLTVKVGNAYSCLNSIKPCQDISDKNLFAAESIQALESNPILCFTAVT